MRTSSVFSTWSFRLVLMAGLVLSAHPGIFAGEKISYSGATSCSSSNCHGGTVPQKNEFTIWATEDKHSKAYGVLFNRDSQVMAKVLKLSLPAHQSETCLVCHATRAPEDRRGVKFDIQEGVGCEACHGAAGRWLEAHTRKGASYQNNLKLGMTDNRNLMKRAENCFSCHAAVDHRLLSAGHPDIVFELDTFSAVMPKHWREKEKWAGAKAWVAGQAVGLRQSMEKLKEMTKKTGRLDESHMNCFSCHHNIYDVSWLVTEDSTGRPLWNASRFAVFRHFLALAFSEEGKGMAEDVALIEKAFREERPDLKETIQAAGRMADKMKGLKDRIGGFSFDEHFLRQLTAAISGDREAYLKGGFRVAEQGLMAVDALTIDHGTPAVRRQVKKLYDILDVKDPAHYDPERFAEEMAKLHQIVST